MTKTFSFFFALAILVGCTPAKPLTEADLAGKWHVDRSFVPNKLYAWPANYYDFCLKLTPDGTFVASNIPDDFFFDFTHTPAAPEHRGTWKLRFEAADNCNYLELTFVTMSGSYGTVVRFNHGKLVITMARDSAVFYLTKED